jgi:hypothetical protein
MAKITVGSAIGKSGMLISSTIYPSQKVSKKAVFRIISIPLDDAWIFNFGFGWL